MLVAVFVAALMVLPAAPPADTSDAGSPHDYAYTIDTGVAGVTGHSDGIWGFEDGYGPFNSFYGLFSGSTGEYMGRLDPYDLTKFVDGQPADNRNNNVMWVLPTVYWGVDEGGSLIISNRDGAGGMELEAYAHTVTDADNKNPKVYDYIAIGVYEGSVPSHGNNDLWSRSGADPQGEGALVPGVRYYIRSDYQGAAANTMDPYVPGSSDKGVTMIWNFYQWELYKYISYTVMGSFDSRSVIGDGHSVTDTGMTDSKGPYYSGGEGTKLFIENPWGGVEEYIGGCWQDGEKTYLSQSSDPKDEPTEDWFGTSRVNGYPGQISKEAKTWGWATGGGGSADTGLTDVTSTDPDFLDQCTGNKEADIIVGGRTDQNGNGLSFVRNVTTGDRYSVDNPWDDPNYYLCSTRLAFAFDDDVSYFSHPDADYTYRLTADGDPVSLTGPDYGEGSTLSIKSVRDETGADVPKATRDGNNRMNVDEEWEFDPVSGYGPFNSFYALFDRQTGELICHLNPYNLDQRVDGTRLTGDELKGNVMWVLPTVYWSTGQGTLTLTNDPGGGTAYAHTVDGKVYPYLALGVYEANVYDLTDKSKAMGSQSGEKPASGKTIDEWRGYAYDTHLDVWLHGKGMVWNFYQWELYKYCSYAVMGSFDSQNAWGYGVTGESGIYGIDCHNNGETSAAGPYYGVFTSTESVKLFIENAWGNLSEYVDGFRSRGDGIYLSQSTDPASGYEKKTNMDGEVHGYATLMQETPELWGWGTVAAATDANVYSLCDRMDIGVNENPLEVGGWAGSVKDDAGISCATNDPRQMSVGTGSRLAIVFSEDELASPVVLHPGDHAELKTGHGLTAYVHGVHTPLPGQDDMVYSREGFAGKFLGWCYDEGLKGDPVTQIPGTENGPVELWAMWEETPLYTVRWCDHDGTVLETDRDLPGGTVPEYNGETPVWDIPGKRVLFAGWDPEVRGADEDAVYTALYAPACTVTWKDADGTVLETDEVPRGAVPEYNGADPAGGPEGTVFSGWDPEVSEAEGDAVYTAVYAEGITGMTQQPGTQGSGGGSAVDGSVLTAVAAVVAIVIGACAAAFFIRR